MKVTQSIKSATTKIQTEIEMLCSMEQSTDVVKGNIQIMEGAVKELEKVCGAFEGHVE